MSRVDQIIAWIDGLPNLMMRRAIRDSWMFAVGIGLLSFTKQLSEVPLGVPGFLQGLFAGALAGGLVALWFYRLVGCAATEDVRGHEILRDALRSESTRDLVARWDEAPVYVRMHIAQVMRLREEPEAQLFLFGEARAVDPQVVLDHQERQAKLNAEHRSLTRMIAAVGWPLLGSLVVAVAVSLTGSLQLLEGRRELANTLQDLSKKVLLVGGGIALIQLALTWRSSFSSMRGWSPPATSTDQFQAWKNGDDVALSRLLSPGVRVTDSEAQNFIAKLKADAGPRPKPFGSLWPLWRPTDSLEQLLKD